MISLIFPKMSAEKRNERNEFLEKGMNEGMLVLQIAHIVDRRQAPQKLIVLKCILNAGWKQFIQNLFSFSHVKFLVLVGKTDSSHILFGDAKIQGFETALADNNGFQPELPVRDDPKAFVILDFIEKTLSDERRLMVNRSIEKLHQDVVVILSQKLSVVHSDQLAGNDVTVKPDGMDAFQDLVVKKHIA